jgi:hypothetical protein
MTDALSSRLCAIHAAHVGEPLPERIEEASCGPHVKQLAHLAMFSAEAGGTPGEWRAWVRTHVPEVSPQLLAEAEECMRTGGLWPWNADGSDPDAH